MKMDLGLEKIEKTLYDKEQVLDQLMADGRKVVRSCSNAIKAMHSREMEAARASLQEAETALKALEGSRSEFRGHMDHMYQEYAEARIVLSAVDEGKIPSFDDLGVPEVPYLNGLLDAVGELKREMYESLRKKKKADAERFFAMMEGIYDSLLPLRFSNAVLPEFRRKQDSARHQVEQARGELL
jgi:translin